MNRRHQTLVAHIALVIAIVALPGMVSAEGGLYLERYFERLSDGVAGAQVWVYDEQGALLHSGTGIGAHEPGNTIPLDEGWYWVEVGRERTVENLQRFYVSDGQHTIIPTGWVSVGTVPVGEQSSRCDNWNAELRAYRVGADGQEHLVATNRNTGIDEFGMLQLPVGEFRVYFNSFPSDVTIRAGEVYRLPTGYQEPPAGERPQLALHEEGTPGNVVRSMCSTGAMHLPAGDYWVSRMVPTQNYPFEERVWNRVAVPASEGGDYETARVERVRDVYDGEGSDGRLIAVTDTTVRQSYDRGAQATGTMGTIDLTLPD